MDTDNKIKQLEKIQTTLRIRGANISEQKAKKMEQIVTSVINSLKSELDCDVCLGTGERLKNGKRFTCVPCKGTGLFWI